MGLREILEGQNSVAFLKYLLIKTYGCDKMLAMFAVERAYCILLGTSHARGIIILKSKTVAFALQEVVTVYIIIYELFYGAPLLLDCIYIPPPFQCSLLQPIANFMLIHPGVPTFYTFTESLGLEDI